MRKQHGIVFEAPRCPVCGEELTLSRMALGWAERRRVEYLWCCDAVERSLRGNTDSAVVTSLLEQACDVTIYAHPDGPYAVPGEIIAAWGDERDIAYISGHDVIRPGVQPDKHPAEEKPRRSHRALEPRGRGHGLCRGGRQAAHDGGMG